MATAWIQLLSAGIFEAAFAICLNLSCGFTKLWPTVMTIIFMIISFSLLSVSMKVIPMGTAYAVWTGLGVMGTFVIGILFFHEDIHFLRALSFILIASGTIIMQLSTKA